MFNSSAYLLENYYLDKIPYDTLYSEIKEGISKVRARHASMVAKIEEEKSKPIFLRPPF